MFRLLGVPVLLLAMVMGASVGCTRAVEDPPVATLSVTARRPRFSPRAPVDLTCRFEVLPNAVITQDYRVFVHVLDADGGVVWNDDHEPSVPTSQWKPGQTIEYTRTRFVPAQARAGEVTVTVGLYRDDAPRLVLEAGDQTNRAKAGRAYRVAAFQIQPDPDMPFLVYRNGWHPEEASIDDPAASWSWTQRSALATLRNPRADRVLMLEYSARPDYFTVPQRVTVLVNDVAVDRFQADSVEARLRRIDVSAAQWGTRDPVDVRIDVDQTFVPADQTAGARDFRNLGLQVHHLVVDTR